jgi:hypothetical protein
LRRHFFRARSKNAHSFSVNSLAILALSMHRKDRLPRGHHVLPPRCDTGSAADQSPASMPIPEACSRNPFLIDSAAVEPAALPQHPSPLSRLMSAGPIP